MEVRFPGAARAFSPRVNFQCRLFCGVRTPPCAIAFTNICAHVKDPVVHVRVQWIMETLKHPACTLCWIALLCRSWLSPGEGNPNFPWEKSHWENVVVKSKKIKLKKYYDPGVQYGITDNYDPYNSELYITVTCAI